MSSGECAHDDRSGSPSPELTGGEIDVSELIGAAWRKSTYSTYNGACVGFAVLRGELVGVRDTKDADASRALLFSKAAWNAFLADLKAR